ncbi:hypothetical protein BJX66DRAFT_346983 [Aspergillus keveii]|uniref:N-acetyltransferase domain-containing protein n=1 Tax=Aspergillus keveii TaxID=714993 RepID=A0ABR4FSB2_9EURO
MAHAMGKIDPESPEFEEVIAGQIDSFNKPYQSLFRLYYPIFGHESEEEKKVAFKNLVELERQWARDDPDCRWIRAIDTEQNNKLAAGALFKISKENPFGPNKSKKDESAVWYPAGGQREYIDEAARILGAPRERYMQRPHLYCYIGYVVDEYRESGLAHMMLGEECRLADELGLEAYMESVAWSGVALWMRHGFFPAFRVDAKPRKSKPEEEWLQMQKKMEPMKFWPMWRPPYGKWDPGVRPPWFDQQEVRTKL